MAIATIDKTSVREEVDRLRREFEQLCADGTVTPDIRVVVNSLLVVVELILSIFLESKTQEQLQPQLAPSQAEKDETSTNSDGRGKERRLAGEVRKARTVETVTAARVETCDVCGVALDRLPCSGHERQTRIDLVFDKVVEHVDTEIKQCPNCEATVKGTFPADMPGTLQCGNGLKVFAIHLILGQMLSLIRVQKQISIMIGSTLSKAGLLKFILRLY